MVQTPLQHAYFESVGAPLWVSMMCADAGGQLSHLQEANTASELENSSCLSCRNKYVIYIYILG